MGDTGQRPTTGSSRPTAARPPGAHTRGRPGSPAHRGALDPPARGAELSTTARTPGGRQNSGRLAGTPTRRGKRLGHGWASTKLR